MDLAHRAVLRRLRLELSGQLLVLESIVPHLFQEGILSEVHVQDIESRTSDQNRTLYLLDLLPKRGPRAFDAFLRALDDFSWVRERLLLELEKTEPQQEPGSGLGPKQGPDHHSLPPSVLVRVPTDRELARLAAQLGSQWEVVLLDLGLSVEDLFRCRSDHAQSLHGAVLAGLLQWRRAQGRRATIQRLMESLSAADIHHSVLENILTDL
ncbi:death domain-containing protein CRADD [Gouania willdenowi]|uniref:Death domain-containing protein CRADD-like n=1 Tax=Gouania willdenowi TaxID=441366 RepID=A0A8C5HKC6_GOUWI|nr:death domain-containing protein CRADD-like [Gouania willdenowi]